MVNNTITVSDFATDGTLGTASSFTLNLTEQAPVGPFADAFSFFLLDATGWLPLFPTTDDPAPSFSAGTLFQVDIDGSPTGALQVFTPANPGGAVTWTVEPLAAAIPLPSTALLLGAGLLGGLTMRRRSGKRS